MSAICFDHSGRYGGANGDGVEHHVRDKRRPTRLTIQLRIKRSRRKELPSWV